MHVENPERCRQQRERLVELGNGAGLECPSLLALRFVRGKLRTSGVCSFRLWSLGFLEPGHARTRGLLGRTHAFVLELRFAFTQPDSHAHADIEWLHAFANTAASCRRWRTSGLGVTWWSASASASSSSGPAGTRTSRLSTSRFAGKIQP